MSTWIPESERTTAWYLWNKKFLCRVSNLKSMSVEYLQHFGMPAIGDPRYDAEMSNELVQRMLTINQMAEFFRNKVDVYVVNYKDTKTIYELISNHLTAWKKELEYGFHTRNAPIEDLILLDQFAMAVYKHARTQFSTEMVDSIIARRMSTTLRVTRDRILRPKEELAPMTFNGSPEEKPPQYPERQSMAEAFARHRSGGMPPSANGTSRWK